MLYYVKGLKSQEVSILYYIIRSKSYRSKISSSCKKINNNLNCFVEIIIIHLLNMIVVVQNLKILKKKNKFLCVSKSRNFLPVLIFL